MNSPIQGNDDENIAGEKVAEYPKQKNFDYILDTSKITFSWSIEYIFVYACILDELFT